MLARLTSAKRYGAVYVSRVTHGLGKSRWVYAERRDLEHPDIILHQPIELATVISNSLRFRGFCALTPWYDSFLHVCAPTSLGLRKCDVIGMKRCGMWAVQSN